MLVSHHLYTMPDKGVLRKRLGQRIGRHHLGATWEELDDAKPHMLTEVMPHSVDVLGARTELGKASKLQGTGVVLKHLAVDIGFSSEHRETLSLDLCHQFYGWDDILEGH